MNTHPDQLQRRWPHRRGKTASRPHRRELAMPPRAVIPATKARYTASIDNAFTARRLGAAPTPHKRRKRGPCSGGHTAAHEKRKDTSQERASPTSGATPTRHARHLSVRPPLRISGPLVRRPPRWTVACAQVMPWVHLGGRCTQGPQGFDGPLALAGVDSALQNTQWCAGNATCPCLWNASEPSTRGASRSRIAGGGQKSGARLWSFAPKRALRAESLGESLAPPCHRNSEP